MLDQCSAIVLKAGKEGQYEKEGYGQRPYDNWETVMIDCNGRVSVAVASLASAGCQSDSVTAYVTSSMAGNISGRQHT